MGDDGEILADGVGRISFGNFLIPVLGEIGTPDRGKEPDGQRMPFPLADPFPFLVVAFFGRGNFFSYRSRASERVVFSDSCRETKIPRAISDSTTAAQASASAFVSKVREVRSKPFLLMVASHAPLRFLK